MLFSSQITELTVYQSISVDFLTLVTLLHLCEDESDTDRGFTPKYQYSGLVQFATEYSGSSRKDMFQAILQLSILQELILLQKTEVTLNP